MIEELLGSVPAGWRYLLLGDVCRQGGGDVQTGPFGSQLHAADYVPTGIPSIMPQNIGDNRIIERDIARVRETDAERLSRYRVRQGDIVYSRRGDVERRALIGQHEDGWLCGTGCLRVRLGQGVAEPAYAAYYLGHPAVREWIVRHAHGATMANLNTAILSACPFVLPPLPVQHSIAFTLGSLDDKIDLNRRMNETLEAMARAIFEDWFVDFGPTRAKMEGRAPYLPPDIWSLFPDRLDDDGQPESWRLLTWGDVATLEYGRGLRGYEAAKGSVPVYGTNGQIGWCEHPLCPTPGVIIGRKGAYRGVHYSSVPFYVIDTAFYLAMRLPFSFRWAFYLISRLDINSMDSGSAIPSTSREDFYKLPLLYAPEDLHVAFDDLLAPIWRKQTRNDQENGILAATRDLLLSKLISGEVRIIDTEKTLEEVL